MKKYRFKIVNTFIIEEEVEVPNEQDFHAIWDKWYEDHSGLTGEFEEEESWWVEVKDNNAEDNKTGESE